MHEIHGFSEKNAYENEVYITNDKFLRVLT